MDCVMRIFLLLTFTSSMILPVCHGACGDAENCVEQLTNLVTETGACSSKLKSGVEYIDCVNTEIQDCDTAKQAILQQALDLQKSLFLESCSCSNTLTRYENMYKECLKANSYEDFTHLRDHLDQATNNFYYNVINDSITDEIISMVTCLETQIDGCAPLRRVYGDLYKKFKSLPIILQVLGEYRPINGDQDEKSPIIDDCDGNEMAVLDEIANDCGIKMANRDKQNIVEYCVPIQNQIDCVSTYEDTCPAAATQFLTPRLASYGVTHTIFCTNITIHGIKVNSLNPDCTSVTYHQQYQKCWGSVMEQTSTEPGKTHRTLDTSSLTALFNWINYDNTNICPIFMDPGRVNFTELRECLKSISQQCPIAHPQQGTVVPPPEGSMYDHDLYLRVKNGGITPFQELGAWYLQHMRDHLCYPACVNYTKMETDYVQNCKNVLREKVVDLQEEDPDETKCQEFEDKLSCVSDTSQACPLFQFVAKDLLTEDGITKALTNCGVTAPEILPDDYYTKSTTLAPPKTTKYWTPSTAAPISDDGGACTLGPSLITFFAALVLRVLSLSYLES